jgi:hypothetical protein
VDCEGSLSIDRDLMDEVGMLPYERILCTNAANAARFETYAIASTTRGSWALGMAGHLQWRESLGMSSQHRSTRRAGRQGPVSSHHEPH